jgi:SAM-dependent methyltransferase
MKAWYKEKSTNYYWDANWQYEQPRSLKRIAGDQILSFLLPWLPQHNSGQYKILDAGCGLGEYVAYLSEKGFDVIGLDNSVVALEAVRKYWLDKYKFMHGDILNLKDFPDNHFDLYLSLGVLEHFQEGLLKPLREANRLLKPNGTLIVSVPYVNILRRHIQSSREESGGKEFHQNIFTLDELEKELKSTGFVLVATYPLAMSWAFYGEYRVFRTIPFGKLISRILAKIVQYTFPWFAAHMVLVMAEKNARQQ